MDIFQVIKRVVTEPTAYFRSVGKGKEQLGFAFGYFALLSLVSTLLGLLASLTFFSAFFPLIQNMIPLLGAGAGFSGMFTGGALVRNALFSYAFGLGLSFLWAGLLHVWILLFGGKRSYAKTYELGAYAGTPALLDSFSRLCRANMVVNPLDHRNAGSTRHFPDQSDINVRASASSVVRAGFIRHSVFLTHLWLDRSFY